MVEHIVAPVLVTVIHSWCYLWYMLYRVTTSPLHYSKVCTSRHFIMVAQHMVVVLHTVTQDVLAHTRFWRLSHSVCGLLVVSCRHVWTPDFIVSGSDSCPLNWTQYVVHDEDIHHEPRWIRNIGFVSNLILNNSCEFYYSGVTVTLFVNDKYGDATAESIP